MLRIEHLTKRYGDKTAVDDVSLHIRRGEIYGFIGHNGAGKTTTIKACCGILRFDSGEIYVDGVSVRENPLECKRKIAYIPDNPDLYDYMSGIQFLNFMPTFSPCLKRSARSAFTSTPSCSPSPAI